MQIQNIIIFFIKRDDNYRTITNYFDSKKILYEQVKEIDSGSKKIQILRSDISEGFIDNSTKTVYVSSNDLFGLIKLDYLLVNPLNLH